MKKIQTYISAFAALASVFAVASASAQTQSDSDKDAASIAIMAVSPTEADGIPAGAEASIKNKMSQMASATGLGSMNRFAQFCLLASVDVESKDVVAGAPVRISETLNINFYIVDQFDRKVFATTTVRAKGIGGSEAKAFIQAISGVNARSPQFAGFVAEGRRKIIDYYNENCGKIIAKAFALAKLEQYEEALFLLTQVPEACSECYLHSVAAASEIYNLYLDRLCSQNLAKAKAVWSATQTAEGGLAAGLLLAEISPEANCFADAEDLFEEIREVVGEDKAFARNMEIQRWEFEKKQWDDSAGLESQRIEAARQVGISWGEHQQPPAANPAWILN